MLCEIMFKVLNLFLSLGTNEKKKKTESLPLLFQFLLVLSFPTPTILGAGWWGRKALRAGNRICHFTRQVL